MPPSAPKSLRATAGNARVTLNWQHPGLAGITKYQYRYRHAESTTWLQDWTDIPGSSYTTRSFTVSDLTNDTDYVFSVRGSIGSNAEAAALATATPLAPPAAPDAPEIAKLVAADGTLTAYWHTPEDDPRAPITGYRVQYRPYGSSTWRNVTRANNVLTSQTITSLTNRRPYEVQVSAVNRVGTGQWVTDSAVPQASQSRPSNPSNMETDSKYTVSTMYAYWTSQYGSDNEHADTPDDVDILENSCLQETGFKMFWDLPSSKPARHEAHFITSGGAGDVRHKFGTETVFGDNHDSTQAVVLYGAVKLHKDSVLTVRVRAGSNDRWGPWSPPSNLFCTELHTALQSSQQQQSNDGQQEETPNSPASGEPTITGNAEQSQTLTASTSGISDPDGMDDATFAYQWLRNLGTGADSISGATRSTYTLVDADVGNQVSVQVSFNDDAGNPENVTSTEIYIQEPPPLYGGFDHIPTGHDGENTFNFQMYFSIEPSLNTADVRDHVITVTNGNVTAARMTNPQGATPNIRWEITVQPDDTDDVTVMLEPTTDCTVNGAVCTTSGSMLLNGTAVIVHGPEDAATNSAATGQPTITGSTTVGSILTASTSGIADTNGLDSASFSYQWLRDDANISDATSSTYTIAGEDEGHSIKVRVSFTDDEGFRESLTSDGLYIPIVPLEGFFDEDTVPASHGSLNTTFTFQLYFSVEPTLSFVDVRDDVLTLTNGDVTKVRRINPQSSTPKQPLADHRATRREK